MQKLQLELDFVTSGLKTLHRVDLWPGWDREWGRCPRPFLIHPHSHCPCSWMFGGLG